MFLKRLLTVCFLITFVYLAFPPYTYAYLDPGSGSYIFQLIIAGLAGSLFLLKVYWKKISSLFTSSQEDGDEHEEMRNENKYG